MRKLVDFYYFSGTGNTLLIVKAMKKTFEEKGVEVRLRRIEKNPVIDSDSDIIGLAFPVAVQGTYPFVWNFIKSLPPSYGKKIFMVDTMESFSGGVIGPMKKIVKRKGYRPIGALEIRMPSNLLNKKIDMDENSLKIKSGIEKAEKYAEKLLSGQTEWKRVPVISDFMSIFSKSKILWRLFRKLFKMKSDKDKCTKCGLCEKLCPVDNVTVENLVHFDNSCVFCIRCVSFCPAEAISIEGFGKQIEFKRYRSVKVSELLEDYDEEN